MPLSSSTLIHFTKSKTALKKILEDNFKIFYCKEAIIWGSKKSTFYVPMVSFCDIPLSEIKDHIKKYGPYGIGMTKKWATEKKLNPVLYIEKKSTLSRSLRKSYRHYAYKPPRDINTWTDKQKALSDTLRYIKNYEAPLRRKHKKTILKYRFSDEREWRYVPPYTEQCDMLTSEDYYKTNTQTVDKTVREMRLIFHPDDIKYIIIKDESEIAEFIAHLQHAKGKKYSNDEIKRLTTRIFTTSQIKTDI